MQCPLPNLGHLSGPGWNRLEEAFNRAAVRRHLK